MASLNLESCWRALILSAVKNSSEVVEAYQFQTHWNFFKKNSKESVMSSNYETFPIFFKYSWVEREITLGWMENQKESIFVDVNW